MTYKPLPDYLTIQPSKINGLGLFTLVDIGKGVNLGIGVVSKDSTRVNVENLYLDNTNIHAASYNKKFFFEKSSLKIKNYMSSSNNILSSDFFYLRNNDLIYIKPLKFKGFKKSQSQLLLSALTTLAVLLNVYFRYSAE